MRKELIISADIKSAKSAVKELDGLLKATAKAPKDLKLFDKEEMKALSKWATNQIPEIKKEMSKVKDVMKETSDINIFLKSKKQLTDLETQLKKLGKMQVGQMGETGGLGLGSLRKFLGPAALLGMGVKVVSRGIQGYDQRTGEAGSRLGLMGALGPERYQGFVKSGGPYKGKEYGYDVSQTLEQTNQLVRNVGDLTNLEQVQRTSRAYGLDTGEVIQQMGSLRKVGGKENTQKNYANLLASAIASNLDQGLLAEYMSVTAQFTQQIASEGTADTKQIMRAVSGLVRKGGILEDTARTTRDLGSLNQVMQQSQGARFGFYAQAMEGMLGPKASGSNVLLALNQGLFGADTSRLTALTGRQREELSLGKAGFGKRTKAISGQFEELTKGMDTSSQALIASKLTGIKDAGEALNFIKAMGSGQFDEKTLRKMEKEAKASPMEKAIHEMNKTLDKRMIDVASQNKENLSKLGETIAPSVLGIKEEMLNMEGRTLIPIAKGVSRLADFFVGKKDPRDTIFSGGEARRTLKYEKGRGKTNLLQQLINEDKDVLGQQALWNLENPASSFSGAELRRVQKSSKGANEQQRTNIQMKAWEGIMDQSRTLAQARKEGRKLPQESELIDSIRNMSKLIPSGVSAPQRFKEDYFEGEGLVPHLKAVVGKALPDRPEMQKEFEKPGKKALWDSDKFDKLIQVQERLAEALEGNKRAVDKNTRSKGKGYSNIGAAIATGYRR